MGLVYVAPGRLQLLAAQGVQQPGLQAFYLIVDRLLPGVQFVRFGLHGFRFGLQVLDPERNTFKFLCPLHLQRVQLLGVENLARLLVHTGQDGGVDVI